MNIADGLEFFANRRASAGGVVELSAGAIASAGMVLTITDAIQNIDSIRSRKVMTSAFKKIADAMRRVQGGMPGVVGLEEEEEGMLSLIGDAIKYSVTTLIPAVASILMDAFLFAVTEIVVPVFTFFCESMFAAITLLVANPEVALALGLAVGVGWLSYNAWKNLTTSPSGEYVDGSGNATGFATSGVIAAASDATLAGRIAKLRVELGLPALEVKYGLPPFMLSAIMAQESEGKLDALSPTKVRGLFQITGKTAAWLSSKFNINVNPDNPQQAAEGAAAYLGYLLDYYHGDTKKAITAYNAGQGTVDAVSNGVGTFTRENYEYAGRVEGRWKTLSPGTDIPDNYSAPTGKATYSNAAPQPSVVANAITTSIDAGRNLPSASQAPSAPSPFTPEYFRRDRNLFGTN